MEETETHFKGKVAQKALVVRSDGKVLVTRDSRDPDTWELPGGRLNLGEKPSEGLARELKEELGVDFEVNVVVFVGHYKHKRDNSDALVLVYTASMVDESIPFTVDPIEIAEMEWVTKDTWQNFNLFPEYAKGIKAYFDNI